MSKTLLPKRLHRLMIAREAQGRLAQHPYICRKHVEYRQRMLVMTHVRSYFHVNLLHDGAQIVGQEFILVLVVSIEGRVSYVGSLQ